MPSIYHLGAALSYHYSTQRTRFAYSRLMRGALLGPTFSEDHVSLVLDRNGIAYHRLIDDELHRVIAGLLADGGVIGIFRGPSEFGPRALGNRSIIADAKNPKMQRNLNLKIKFREGFRLFAPMVLHEFAHQYFDGCQQSEYMLFTYPVSEHHAGLVLVKPRASQSPWGGLTRYALACPPSLTLTTLRGFKLCPLT